MKKEESNRETETKILKVLLDFKAHNQNEIIDLSGANHENSTDRVHAHRAIKQLAPYLKRYPNGLDELGKKWCLKEDIETITAVAERFPTLLQDLQANEKTRSLVVNNLYTHIQETYHNLATNEEFKNEINQFSKLLLGTRTGFKLLLLTPREKLVERLSAVVKNGIDGTHQELIDELKVKMMEECNHSPSEVEKLEKTTVIGGLTIEERRILDFFKLFHDTIYEACVFSDILNGAYNPSAVQYIYKKNKRKIEHITDFVFTMAESMSLYPPPHPEHSRAAVKYHIAESLRDMNWAFVP